MATVQTQGLAAEPSPRTRSESRGRRVQRAPVMPSRSVALQPSSSSSSSAPGQPQSTASNPEAAGTSELGSMKQDGVVTNGKVPLRVVTEPIKTSGAPPARQASICQSPTWSPRGSLAARRQADKDRRDAERKLRRDYADAKKRLKEQDKQRTEEEKRQKEMALHDSPKLRHTGRRLTKEPPPAAMETQRLPAALRVDHSDVDSEHGQPTRRRRSSSLTPVLRFFGAGRPGSRGRDSASDDEAYASDASKTSKSSFIGGVKLRQQQRAASQAPPVVNTSRQSSITDFATQMQSQLDKITGRSNQESSSSPNDNGRSPALTLSKAPVQAQVRSRKDPAAPAVPPKDQANGKLLRKRVSPSRNVARPADEARTEPGTTTKDAEPSTREASLNRLQNLVHPLRSAMKGGREIAHAGRTQSMPLFVSTAAATAAPSTATTVAPGQQQPSSKAAATQQQQQQQQPAASTYVRRARMRAESQSLADWKDELAVKQAYELAESKAAAAKEAAAKEAATNETATNETAANGGAAKDLTEEKASHERKGTYGEKAVEVDANPEKLPVETKNPTKKLTSEKTTSQKGPTEREAVGKEAAREKLAALEKKITPEKAQPKKNEAERGEGNRQQLRPQMPPTPDASSDNLPRPRKSTEAPASRQHFGEFRGSMSSDSTAPLQTPTTPGDPDQVVWKAPVRANKAAAAERVDQSRRTSLNASDVDLLPSQTAKRRTTVESAAVKQADPSPDNREKTTKDPPELSRMDSDEASPSGSKSGDGLRRQPAVMSWKVEKEQGSRSKYASPSSPTTSAMSEALSPSSPVAPPPPPPPEEHPSLKALKVDAKSSPESEELLQPHIKGAEAPIERPFSIVPTPVASPATVETVLLSGAKNQDEPEPKVNGEPPSRKEQPQSVVPVKRASPVLHRRHSTPPAELRPNKAQDRDQSLYPFPDRHEPLVKPGKKADMPSAQAQKRQAQSKVSFHTPPESPRFVAAPTSYDNYRRPYSMPGTHGSDDVEDDVELPVSVSQLEKPNPPFAREGRVKTPSPHRNSSPAGSGGGGRGNNGYMFVSFGNGSPNASSSTLNLADGRKMPKGFVLRKQDGQAVEPVAKVFVICCGCGKWHDVPSNVYREMARGLRDIDLRTDGVPEVRVVSRGGNGGDKERSPAGRQSKRAVSGVITKVPCCWCKHEMSTLCCDGWSALCYLSTQHHQKSKQ